MDQVSRGRFEVGGCEDSVKEYKLSAQAMAMVSGSSKGTQPKYFEDGYWYKTDRNGYEGLSEQIASMVLRHSNVDHYVEYERCMVNGKRGCRSASFLHEGESFISLERFYNMYTGNHLSDAVLKFRNVEDRIHFAIDFVKEHADLDISRYISDTLALDALLANDDRHFHNLGIIADQNNNTFKCAPVFDNGSSLLSDFGKYPVFDSIEENLEKVVGKPFSANLYTQAKAAGIHLEIDYEGLQKDIASLEPSRAVSVLQSQLEFYRPLIPDVKKLELKDDPAFAELEEGVAMMHSFRVDREENEKFQDLEDKKKKCSPILSQAETMIRVCSIYNIEGCRGRGGGT